MSHVLHTLRCTGFAGLDVVAEAAGLPADDVESELIDLAVIGLVTRVPGEFGGWGPTDAGKAADDRWVAVQLVAPGVRAAVTAAFEHFLVLNPELLDLCTAWQTRNVGGVPAANNHSDAAYDTRVLELFTEFDARAGTVCSNLAIVLPRFRRYRTRLTQALTWATAGATEYLTDSTASYHSVWFQLHEDLLITLGSPRH